jgi:HlyD family secretion protein
MRALPAPPGHGSSARSARRAMIFGTAVALFLTAGVGGWAATAKLSGAVMAPGQVVVDSNGKKVQHPTGGVVGALMVRDGDRVREGDLLVRLDETVTRANLAMVAKSMDELTARRARLQAEQDGSGEVALPAELAGRAGDPGVGALLAGERRLFEVRRAARAGQEAQLRERIAQLKEQVSGLEEQVGAKQQENELIVTELKGVSELWRQNLVPINRVSSLQREAALLQGEKGALVSSISQSKGKITETELQILQIGQDLRTETGKELAEIRGKLAELGEKRIAAEDQLQRTEIRAPQDGTVYQLAVHTIGGVVNAGEPLMLIVPRADALVVEGRLPPQMIDQARAGQHAILRFSAFDRRTTPELDGELAQVSPDITTDPKSSTSYYTVRVTIPPHEIARLGELKLVPGMPVEVFIQTGERTALSYLVKPLQDQLSRAWRER